jgi:NAD(P)-dependent dehydrogenase (short-subunit alcohol dehydrogenase family)
MFDLEANKAIALRLAEVFNGRRLDLLEDVLHPEFRERGLSAFPPAGPEVGPGGRRNLYEMFYRAIHYGFSKAADLALMRGFAQALAASGVTVNAVLPGPTRTEGIKAAFKSMGKSIEDPEAQRAYMGRPSSIIKRLGTADEVAEVVAFLCSREASVMTGSPVRADGGVVMSIT